MGVRGEVSWLPKQDAELHKLWLEGLSATDISGRLCAPPRTRNAIIGRLHRKGWTRSAGQTAQVQDLRNAKAKRSTMPKLAKAPKGAGPYQGDPHDSPVEKRIAALAANAVVRAAAAALPPPAGAAVVPLEGLGAHACHWPLGDPQHPAFGFCGQPQAEASVYCPHHHQGAYRAPPARAETAKSLARRYG
jgi:GcrA cell cycle regulator